MKTPIHRRPWAAVLFAIAFVIAMFTTAFAVTTTDVAAPAIEIIAATIVVATVILTVASRRGAGYHAIMMMFGALKEAFAGVIYVIKQAYDDTRTAMSMASAPPAIATHTLVVDISAHGLYDAELDGGDYEPTSDEIWQAFYDSMTHPAHDDPNDITDTTAGRPLAFASG